MKILVSLVKTLTALSFFISGCTSNSDTTTEYHQELACLQELLFYEARNTGFSGMTEVATVVQNRTNLKGFPSSYCGVSKQRFQFSFHLDKHKQNINLSPYSLDTAAFNQAGTIARLTLDNELIRPFDASVSYYHSPAVKPKWAHKMKTVLKNKFHLFYSDKSKK